MTTGIKECMYGSLILSSEHWRPKAASEVITENSIKEDSATISWKPRVDDSMLKDANINVDESVKCIEWKPLGFMVDCQSH